MISDTSGRAESPQAEEKARLAFEIGKLQLASQDMQHDTLVKKAGLFAAALAFLFPTAVDAVRALTRDPQTGLTGFLSFLFTFVILGSLAFALVLLLLSLLVSSFRNDPKLDAIKTYYTTTDMDLKRMTMQVFANWEVRYDHNDKILRIKANQIRYAGWLSVISGSLIGLALIYISIGG
ncbi:MAG: hypothetical protein DRJ47_11065 [Thermoprotei archaeon]|nr:MAG: hypothetical protein DRJ47_11065 [Thermoprotei archaeon]